MYGKHLNIDLYKNPIMMRYVFAAIISPLPEDWSELMDNNGKIMYYNSTLNEYFWFHPIDNY